MVCRFQAFSDRFPGFTGVDDLIYPKTGSGVVWGCLAVVSVSDLFQQFCFRFRGDFFAFRLQRGYLYLQERFSRLFAAHDRNFSVGPGEDEPGIVSFAAHGIIARAIGITNDDGDLGHHAVAYGVDQLRPVFDDAGVLGATANHKPSYILQENQGIFFDCNS